jgi:hypothetical protein
VHADQVVGVGIMPRWPRRMPPRGHAHRVSMRAGRLGAPPGPI